MEHSYQPHAHTHTQEMGKWSTAINQNRDVETLDLVERERVNLSRLPYIKHPTHPHPHPHHPE